MATELLMGEDNWDKYSKFTFSWFAIAVKAPKEMF